MTLMGAPQSVGALVHQAARRYGDRTAVIFEDQRWSFAELDRASSRVAAGLHRCGIRPGETVSLCSPNCPEWIIAYYGIMKVGAIVNPLNLMLTPSEAAHAMNDCGAAAMVGSAGIVGSLAGVWSTTRVRHVFAYGGAPPAGAAAFSGLLADDAAYGESGETMDLRQGEVVGLDQPCTVGYTSGTTGHPKGAVLSHRAILMNTAMTATMHVRTAADIVVSALPCSHVYGNIVMNAAIAYGMTLVLHSTFDVGRVLGSIQTHRATMLEGVPTMYAYILDYAERGLYDVSSLTRCTVGGQTMPAAMMVDVEAVLGCPLIELWGMTELGGLGTTHSAYGPRRHGSAGVPLPHLQARIGRTDGAGLVPAGEVGELQMRGPVTMLGYLNNPKATAEAFDTEGWLHTGDLARMDDEGYIFIVDRLKDMIITAGFNIYPAELERVIAQYPDVAMVAVGSVADVVKGELAHAYVVPRRGCTLDLAALDRHCRAQLAAYKVPRAYRIVADLPKTSTGKIARRMLRDLYETPVPDVARGQTAEIGASTA